MKHLQVHWVLTIAGLSGIASIFLNFVFDVSPVDALFDDQLWKLASPFFVAFLISAFQIRWNISARLSTAEQLIAYIAGLLIISVMLFFHIKFLMEKEFVLSISLIVLFTGIFFVIRNFRIGQFRNLSPVMLMQTGYIANGTLCLIAFAFHWQIGAYFTLVAMLAYTAQMLIVIKNRKSQSRIAVSKELVG